MGLLDWFISKSLPTKYDIEQCQRQGLAEMLAPYRYDYQGMAAQRMAHGYKPIDWPTIIVNQFKAIALTRPLNIWEQCMYEGAIQKVKDAQITVKS